MPITKIKPGVRIPPSSAFSVILTIASATYHEHDADCVLTSGIEGDHGWSSEHFKGDAADFRTRHLTTEQRKRVRNKISKRLGPDFDVVLEATHLHVEYDPKKEIN